MPFCARINMHLLLPSKRFFNDASRLVENFAAVCVGGARRLYKVDVIATATPLPSESGKKYVQLVQLTGQLTRSITRCTVPWLDEARRAATLYCPPSSLSLSRRTALAERPTGAALLSR